MNGIDERLRSADLSAKTVTLRNERNGVLGVILWSLDLRSLLIGALIATFALAPVLGAMGFTTNETIYLWSLIGVSIFAGLGILTDFRVTFRFHWGVAAFLAFFLLAFVRLSSLDQDGWTAVASVALCVLVFLLAQAGHGREVVLGLLLGTVMIGTSIALLTLYDPNYAFARTYGWNREREAYLITSPAVAAAVGPLVLAARFAPNTLIKAGVGLWALFLVYSLANLLGRTALLAGGASLFLALSYSAESRSHSRLVGLVRAVGFLLPVIPIALSTLSNNAYLWNRLQRMIDPANELEAGGRGYIWRSALDYIGDHAVWGGGVTAIQRRLGVYPHNALLEAWGDLGIFGAAALFAFLVAFGFSFWRAMMRGSVLGFALHLVALTYVLEALKSGSVYSSRPFFIFSCLAFIYYSVALFPRSERQERRSQQDKQAWE